ncbi:MAG: serine/threonine protein kinase, partial [Burkholderiales bacterium]|nr:serine/threonine protein kinase [Opitutaceae bacterium]
RPGLDADPGFAERFTREARALAQLNHSGIVTLYEFGRTPAGRYFILMEFVDGMNLRALLDAGRLAPREALAIVPPLCDALQYAHDRGLVHRDIKPENLLIDRLGRIKIADFGIARLASKGGDGPPGRPPESPAFTSAGVVIGTPHYMAPEQRTAPDAVDHRADLYALGVVLYQMLTGELPAPGQLRPPSTRVQLDVRLDEIVLRALEKDPARRYAAARDFKTEIETVANTPPPPAPSLAPPSPASPPPGPPTPALTLARTHANRAFSPWLIVLLLGAIHLGALDLCAMFVPAPVASYFNAYGIADGIADVWPHVAYLQPIGIVPCALAALLALVGWTFRYLPAHLIILPRRHHWLARERRVETDALFFRWMAGPACLLLVLYIQIHFVTILVYPQTPVHLSSDMLVGPVIGFLVVLMIWIIGLLLRFAEPEATPAKLHRQSRAMLLIALLALLLPALPILFRIALLLYNFGARR